MVFALFTFFNFLALYHSVNTDCQRVVHELLDHLFSNCLHVLASVVELGLLTLFDYFCLVATLIVHVFAHSLKCVFFRDFLCFFQVND